MKHNYSRRDMLKTAAATAALSALAPSLTLAASATISPAAPKPLPDPWHGLKIGVASYSLRNMKLDDAIKAIKRVGLNYVSIKEMHLPLNSTTDQRKEVASKFKSAGITPLSCGVIYMKNNEAELRKRFDYARDAGIPTIVCDPDPEALPILDKLVKEYDIHLAIHNHGPGSKTYVTPEDTYRAVEKFDGRIGLCIDVGHTARAGADPADSILKFRDRLFDVHLKDINIAAPKGGCVESGRGVLDLKAIMAALLKIQYPHLAAFEYEKDANDPLPGLAETVGYTKGLVVGISA